MCRCNEETTESEPTDEDYSYEGDEDTAASYESYTKQPKNHQPNAQSDVHKTAVPSTIKPITMTETSIVLAAELSDIHNKGKLNSNINAEIRKSNLHINLAKKKHFVDSACPRKCQCDDIHKLVNCSTRQFHELPENLPKNVEVLDLSNNQLARLNISTLKKYTSLRTLLLAHNQIESIIDKAVSSHFTPIRFFNLVN